MFVENILNFAGVSLTLFAVAHLYMFVSHDKIIKPTTRCRYCRKFISIEVRLLLVMNATHRSINQIPGKTLRKLLQLARWKGRLASR